MRNYFTTTKLRRARELAARGFSAAQIGSLIGMSRSAVLQANKRHGIGLCDRLTLLRSPAFRDAQSERMVRYYAERRDFSEPAQR